MQLQSYLGQEDILNVVSDMAEKIRLLTNERGLDKLAIIGIRTGGVLIAEQLHRLLKIKDPMGTLDIAFYRDDFSQIGLNPEVKPSQIPFDVDDRIILLVDDVIHTGRTIRAALNEIFDYGRPARVILVALVERDGRHLPIQPDIIGLKVSLSDKEQIKLVSHDQMELVIGSRQ
jgi:pyrimidine operon attenuation protein/uracil phosphoribosyltransferase